jgi:hypothetical protein
VKILAGLVVVVALACAGAALWWAEPWADDGGSEEIDLAELSAEYQGSACRRLAGLAAKLAESEPTPVVFLRDLGKRAAGIRQGPRAYGDLARGGRNVIVGRGFLRRFDDGTQGQVRHFAGIAIATSLGGGSYTRRISIFVRDDPLDSPDGQLTEEGIAFASEVLSGDLDLEETPEWLLEHLCRRQ